MVNYMRKNAIKCNRQENRISRHFRMGSVWVGEVVTQKMVLTVHRFVHLCVSFHSHLFLSTYVTDSRARGGAGGGTYHRNDAFG